MKKLFTIACSVALLNIFSLAHAQTQDSTLAKAEVKKSTPNPAVGEIATTTMEKSSIVSTPSSTVSPLTQFKIEDVRMKRSALDNKVGPNGEEVLMRNNKFYYLDDQGKKVKVRSSALQDKPKHS